MSDLTEWLKERRDVLNSDRDLVAEDMAVRQFPALLTAVEKVLELHHGERDEYGCWTCRFCSHIQQAKILYPCATVRTIEGATK